MAASSSASSLKSEMVEVASFGSGCGTAGASERAVHRYKVDEPSPGAQLDDAKLGLRALDATGEDVDIKDDHPLSVAYAQHDVIGPGWSKRIGRHAPFSTAAHDIGVDRWHYTLRSWGRRHKARTARLCCGRLEASAMCKIELSRLYRRFLRATVCTESFLIEREERLRTIVAADRLIDADFARARPRAELALGRGGASSAIARIPAPSERGL